MTFSILAADGLSHVNQLYDKLVAYHAASITCRKITDKIVMPQMAGRTQSPLVRLEDHPATDVSTGLAFFSTRRSLYCLIFSTQCILEGCSCSKPQYVLDHVSCSVGGMFPVYFNS